jgi:hypothetical protein
MSAADYELLRGITTATITTMLLKKGIRRCWMNGPKPLAAHATRLVGPAFTLRFVPAREDLATPEAGRSPSPPRRNRAEGCIAVADAMGTLSAGIFGDILTMRMVKRKVAALVTDGVVRDKAGAGPTIAGLVRGVAAPASVNGLTLAGRSRSVAAAKGVPGRSSRDQDGAGIPRTSGFVVDGNEHERAEWIVRGSTGEAFSTPERGHEEALRGFEAHALELPRTEMFFTLKILGFFANPSNLVVAFWIAGLVLLATRWARSRWLVGTSFVAGDARPSRSVCPIIRWSSARPGTPRGPPDGIPVLGGAISPDVSHPRRGCAQRSQPNGSRLLPSWPGRVPQCARPCSGRDGRAPCMTGARAPFARRELEGLGSPRRIS